MFLIPGLYLKEYFANRTVDRLNLVVTHLFVCSPGQRCVDWECTTFQTDKLALKRGLEALLENGLR